MTKLFKKPESSFFMPFSIDMSLDFCVFLNLWKKSKKKLVHIYQVREGQREKHAEKETDILPNHHTICRSNKPSRQ